MFKSILYNCEKIPVCYRSLAKLLKKGMTVAPVSDMLKFLWTIILVLLSYFEAIFRSFFPQRRKDLNGKIVLITG